MIQAPESDARARVVARTARVVACGVFLLLIAGAMVTSTESGLAVPDWPLSYGKVMPPMVGGIKFEHGHRLVAALVSTLVGLEVAVLFWGERRRRVRLLGVVAFGAILAQAGLGGLTVLLRLPPEVSTAHAVLAEVVFGLTASIALLTSPSFRDGGLFRGADEARIAPARRAAALGAGAVLVQILLGAVVRHTAAGLAVPDFPTVFGRALPTAAQLAAPGVAIHLAHRLGALIVAVLIVRAVARQARTGAPALERLAGFWLAALFAQMMLGPLVLWSGKAPAVTVTHLAFGALTWAAGVLSCVALAGARQAAAARSEAAEPFLGEPAGSAA